MSAWNNYDNWRTSYPDHWDDPLVICDICTSEVHEDKTGSEDGKILCESCIEDYKNGTL